ASGSDQPARDLGALPPRLRDLIEQSIKLQARVIRLDRMLGYKQLPPSGEAEHPLKTQLSRLRAAVGSEADSAAAGYLRKPSYVRSTRVRRRPRSTRCWPPPVQAGWVFESMSSFSVSPSDP